MNYKEARYPPEEVMSYISRPAQPSTNEIAFHLRRGKNKLILNTITLNSVLGILTREDGTETSVNNYHTTPCNYPEDHRFHQHRGGSLKSNEISSYIVKKSKTSLISDAKKFSKASVRTKGNLE